MAATQGPGGLPGGGERLEEEASRPSGPVRPSTANPAAGGHVEEEVSRIGEPFVSGSPAGGPTCLLAVDPLQGLALLAASNDQASFEGIALGPGVYTDAAGRRIRVRPEHLPLVAERLPGVFLRDLHREDLGASVGIVASARVAGAEVRFTGDVRMAPYVELVRHFWPHIRFSLGFRYDPAGLRQGEDGTYDLPLDFLLDHLALVPQGQYANARLVRLLNQARSPASSSSAADASRRGCGGTRSDEPERRSAEARSDDVPRSGEPQRADVNVAVSGAPQRADVRDFPMVNDTETPEMKELRQQRDDAVKAAKAAEVEGQASRLALKNAEAASEASRRELTKARADLDLAQRAVQTAEAASEASRRELGQAKNRLAAEVMKLELAAGNDFDLDQRKQELTVLDISALDGLRSELRLAAEETAEAEAPASGGSPAPTTRGDRPAGPGVGGAPAGRAGGLDLERLTFTDTLRLAAERGVL